MYRDLRVRKPHVDSLILCTRPQSLLVKRFQAFVSFAPSDKVYYSLHFCLFITIKEIVPNEPTLVINPLLNLPEIWSVLLWDYNEQLFIGGCNPVCTNTALVSQKWVHLFWPNLLAYLQFVNHLHYANKKSEHPIQEKDTSILWILAGVCRTYIYTDPHQHAMERTRSNTYDHGYLSPLLCWLVEEIRTSYISRPLPQVHFELRDLKIDSLMHCITINEPLFPV